MRSRWSYVALTAVLATVVAVWAIPHVGDSSVSVAGEPPRSQPPLPSLSPDLFLIPPAAQILLLAVGIGLLVQIYSTAYLGHHPRYRSYALVIVLFLLAMAAVVATTNLWVLLVGWEVMGLCSYLLIGHEWETAQARAGAAKAFLMTRTADLGLVLAILVIGQTYGTYDILGTLTGASEDPRNSTAIGLLLLVAVVGKSAQFPLHTWLPDAMPGPTPITALIHAATMVAAGVYVAARLFGLYSDSTVALTAMAAVAAITMLLGAVMALVQSDLKRALAWSTVSQLAFMFATIAAGDREAGTDHLLSHGVFKALLFLGCGCLMRAVGSSDLSAMGGLRRSMPVTFWTMTIGYAALAGLVPTAGFFTKDSVLEALRHGGDGALPVGVAVAVLVVAVLTSLLTAAYATRLWLAAFFGSSSPVERRASPVEPVEITTPRAMTGPLVVLALATFILSVGQPVHLGVAIWSTLVALAGVGVTVLIWSRRGNLDVNAPSLTAELGLDAPYSRWIPSLVRGSARAVVVVDRDGVDSYPRASARLAAVASHGLGLVQSRNVQRYATVIAAGVIAITAAAVIWT